MSVEFSKAYFTEGQSAVIDETSVAQITRFSNSETMPPPTLAELASIASDEHTILTDKGIPSSLHHTAGAALRSSGLSNDQLWRIVKSQAYGLPLKSMNGEPSIQAFLDKALRTEPNPTRQVWVAAREVVVWKASQ